MSRCPTCGQPMQLGDPRNGVPVAPAARQSRTNGHGSGNGGPPRAVSIPARRIPPEALAAARTLMDSLHLVEGRWMRLGDMRRQDLASAAAEYDRQSERAKRRAETFRKLVAILGPTTVEERFTDEKLASILGGREVAAWTLCEPVAIGECP